jgi:hypothetical protein
MQRRFPIRRDARRGYLTAFLRPLILTQVNRSLMDKALRLPALAANAHGKPGQTTTRARNLAGLASGAKRPSGLTRRVEVKTLGDWNGFLPD